MPNPKAKKKLGAKLSYDIYAFRSESLKAVPLTRSEIKDVASAFGGVAPSAKFLSDFERNVEQYVWYLKKVNLAAPGKMAARMKRGLRTNAVKLLLAIQDLEPADHGVFNRAVGNVAELPRIDLSEFWGYLAGFVFQLDAAIASLDVSPEGGRMPAYAEQCLAKEILRSIRFETGIEPTRYKNGKFAKLLILALNIGDKRLRRNIGKERRNVRALMDHAIAQRDGKLPPGPLGY